MKLEYVCAFAFQTALTRHTSVDKISTGRLPNVELIGILHWINLHAYENIPEDASYHTKLQKPATRIGTPMSCTTSFKFESNSSINCGNIGAKAKGPNPWVKVAALAHTREENFQKVLQFYSRISSGVGL